MFTIVTNAQTSSNEKAAREWITAHSRELNIKPYHNFKLSFVRKGLAGETLRFQQMVNDVPVYDNEIVINFVNSDEVAFSSNNYDETIENINTTPTISKNEAVITSNNSLGFKGEITNQECNLVVTKINNQTKLVYRVVTIAFDMKGSWEVSVDAQTGDVMSKKDVAIYHHNNDKKVKKKKRKKRNVK